MSQEAVQARAVRMDAASSADAAVVADQRVQAAARFLQSMGVGVPSGLDEGKRLDLNRGIVLYEVETPSGARSEPATLAIQPDRVVYTRAPGAAVATITFDDLDDVAIGKRFGSVVLGLHLKSGDEVRVKGLSSREASRFKEAVSIVEQIGSSPLDDDTWVSVIMRQLDGLGSAGLLTFRQMADKQDRLNEMDYANLISTQGGGQLDGLVIIPLDRPATIDLRDPEEIRRS